MSTISKYIKLLQDHDVVNEENGTFNNSIPVGDAVDILERFEIELINNLDCEKLENLKKI